MKLARIPDGSPELFHTLQGEGPTLGAPAVFLRLSLCNLHCQWCDTPYTWNWEKTPWKHHDGIKFSKSEQILELSPAEIAPLISDFDCDRLVLTGGEPLLQQSELTELLHLLPEIPHIEVETNGSQIPDDTFISMPTQFNVSPKLSNSGMTKSLRLNPEALYLFSSLPNAIFKFVLSSENDLEEIQSLQERYEIPASRIFLMPEGRSPEETSQKSLWLADLCRDQGYRFTPRLHVLLWGDKRGK
jgi:organic radical activating enzyme